MPDPDPLAELRDQIRLTEAAARRLAGEASAAREQHRAGEVPPAGWATPEDHATQTAELQSLAALVAALRELVPPELAGQVREVMRQVLLLLRAVIDWWVERIEQLEGAPARPAEPRVQDIPLS